MCRGRCHRNRRFGPRPCCQRQIPVHSRCFSEMVSASANSHFHQPSISGPGLNPTAHIKGMPVLEDSPSWKRIQSCCILWQKHRPKKCCPVTPSHSVQATGHSMCQLQIHFLSKDSIHLLRGCPGMACLSLSGAPRQKAQQALCVSRAPASGGQGHMGMPLICIQRSCFGSWSSAMRESVS